MPASTGSHVKGAAGVSERTPPGLSPRAGLIRANSYHLDRLRAGLRPFRLHWFPVLRSTSDHAAALRRRGELFAPAVVLTGRQTAGRGRGDHRWWSGPGCVTVT